MPHPEVRCRHRVPDKKISNYSVLRDLWHGLPKTAGDVTRGKYNLLIQYEI